MFLLIVIYLSFFTLTDAYAVTNHASQIAAELNALYNAKGDCKDKPDYYCSGIILRSDLFNKTQWWYLSEKKDHASFTYLRRDLAYSVGKPIYPNSIMGYILTPQKDLAVKGEFSYQVYCSYPNDGLTDSRSMHGCGDFTKNINNQYNFNNYSTCYKEGIFTLNQYIQKYAARHGCSFSPDKTGFKLTLELGKYLFNYHKEVGCKNLTFCQTWNELVISSWTTEKIDVNRIPIKAIFVLINGGKSYGKMMDAFSVNHALHRAHREVNKYNQLLNPPKYIPIVTLDIQKLKNGEANIFSSVE